MPQFSWNQTKHFYVSFWFFLLQEPTEAHPPQKAEPAPASPSNPEKEPQSPADPLYSPSLALLRLLQTAFNRQGAASQQQQQHTALRPSSAWRKQQLSQAVFPTKFPAQKLYQALDLINKHRGPEDSLYSDYSDGFYSIKPYRHRDDRLLQALFQMLDDTK